MKAIILMVQLVYLGTLYVHPVTRQIFRNIVVQNWPYSLSPCRKKMGLVLINIL